MVYTDPSGFAPGTGDEEVPFQPQLPGFRNYTGNTPIEGEVVPGTQIVPVNSTPNIQSNIIEGEFSVAYADEALSLTGDTFLSERSLEAISKVGLKRELTSRHCG